MKQNKLDKYQRIAEFLTRLLLYYREPPLPQEVFDIYIEDLAELSLEDLQVAIQIYRSNPKHFKFPLPSQLKALVQLSDDEQARDAVARIISALGSYGGGDNTRIARKHIGLLGWALVNATGGWIEVSRMTYQDLDNQQARWREHAKVLLAKKKIGIPWDDSVTTSLMSPDSPYLDHDDDGDLE